MYNMCMEITVYSCDTMYVDFVRQLLNSATYTQCLLQADRVNSEAKGVCSLNLVYEEYVYIVLSGMLRF